MRRLIRAATRPVNHGAGLPWSRGRLKKGVLSEVARSNVGKSILVRYLKPLLIALVLAGLALAAWHSGLGETLSWRGLARHQARLVALAEDHPILAPLVYWLVYTVWVAVSIPEAALLTAAGGLFFGTLLGGAVAVLGATSGAVVLFLVARSALAGTMRRRAGPLLDRIQPGLHRDGFSYLLALRLVPTPFWLVNLAAAVCGMRLLPFTAATLVGIIPMTFVLAWIGAGVGDVLAAGRSPDLHILFSPSVLGPLGTLALLSLLPVAWRWFRRSR